jgi:hypothetical protein
MEDDVFGVVNLRLLSMDKEFELVGFIYLIILQCSGCFRFSRTCSSLHLASMGKNNVCMILEK